MLGKSTVEFHLFPATFHVREPMIFTCGYAGIVIVGFHVLLLTKWSKVAKTTILTAEN